MVFVALQVFYSPQWIIWFCPLLVPLARLQSSVGWLAAGPSAPTDRLDRLAVAVGPGLAILPRTGHTANLEEPDVFNRLVDRFLAAVERGAWPPRDPRSLSASTTGIEPR